MDKLKNAIKNWLDIKEPKDWYSDFEELENRTWKYEQVLKDRVKSACPVCSKSINMWPMEDEAYYTHGGKAYHVECYNKR
jgi:hypothetical protein